MSDQTTIFLKSLYQHCNEGFIKFRFLPPEKNQFIPLTKISHISSILEAHKGQNVYFESATRINGDGTKQGIVKIPALYVDIDLYSLTDKRKEENRQRFKNFPLKPTFVIDSGGGRYFLWMLKEPASREEIPRIENFLKELAFHFNGNLETIDVNHPLRVPGSLNYTYQHTPQVIIKDFHSERQYSLDDFNFLLQKEATNKEEKRPVSTNENKPLIEEISVELDSQVNKSSNEEISDNLTGASPQAEDGHVDIIDEGWIKLYRKSIHSQVFQNEGLWKLWTWCLLKANHKDGWVLIKTGKGTSEVFIKRGQFIFGRKTASKELKMKPATVQKRIVKLKSMQNLITQSNSHYSIVSILNYELYQGERRDEVSPKVSGKYQASITNKNDKNIKIYVEGSDELRLTTLLLEEIQRNKKDRNLSPFKQPDLQKWAKEVDLMMRRDGRKPERIEAVIRWCQKDPFWWKNILSTGKLRKQFERLEAEMEEKKPSFKTERPQVEYKDFTGAGQKDESLRS